MKKRFSSRFFVAYSEVSESKETVMNMLRRVPDSLEERLEKAFADPVSQEDLINCHPSARNRALREFIMRNPCYSFEGLVSLWIQARRHGEVPVDPTNLGYEFNVSSGFKEQLRRAFDRASHYLPIEEVPRSSECSMA